MFAALGLKMEVSCIDENHWTRGDYRDFAAINLDIDHFEKVLDEKAFEYYEDGLGPAKALMCKYGHKQFYIRWLEFSDSQHKTTISVLYPFDEADELLSELILQLNITNECITWKYGET